MFSIIIPFTIATSSLLDAGETSISQAFLRYAFFYAPISIISSIFATVVSVTVFIYMINRRSNFISIICSFMSVSIVGLIAAALVGQFQELDILSFVIFGTCLGALVGPIGASVREPAVLLT